MAESIVKLIVDATQGVRSLGRFKKATNEVEGAFIDANGRLRDAKGRFLAAGAAADKASLSFGNLSKTLSVLAAKATAAFTIVQAARFVFVKTAEIEKQAKSLEVLTGSVDKAKNIIKELQDFGSVTPFTSSELIETAKRLKAFGVDTEKLVETTKRLGDVAGATGADLDGIATAYGQIQAKGKLQTEELLQLQERGVDLAGVLKKEYGLTGEEFSKALQKGQISAEAAEFALRKLTETGGQYAGGAIAQSDTLSGKFSTLQDNIDSLARRIGAVLSPAIKGVVGLAIDALNTVNQLLTASERSKAFGLNIQQRKKILRQAEEEAKEIALIRGGGKLDPAVFNQLKQERERDLIEAYGFEQGLIIPEITAPKIAELPALSAGTSKSTGRTGRATRRGPDPVGVARNLAQLAKDRVQAFEDQALLASAVNETERKNFQLNIDIAELQKNAKGFAQEDVDAQIAARIALENKRNEAEAYKKTIAETAKEEADSLARFLSDFDAAFQELDAKAKAQADKMDALYASIGQTISTSIVDSLTAAVDGTKRLSDVASDTLRSLASILLKFGLNSLLGGLAGDDGVGVFSKLFGRAKGGTVMGGTSYIVGERGPELFTPGRSGSIAPNSSMGGGANVVVNVDASGTKAEGDGRQANQLGAALGAAVQAELIKQKRPGGLLAA
jgi:tape measure domain-containing protein